MLVYKYIHISANTTFLKEYKNIQENTRFEKNCIGGFLVYCSVLLLFIIIFIQLFDEEKNRKPRNIYSIYNKYSW